MIDGDSLIPMTEGEFNTDNCECVDPKCPVCHGRCSRVIGGFLFRIDQVDEFGTGFCGPCGDDAMKSGVFTTESDPNER